LTASSAVLSGVAGIAAFIEFATALMQSMAFVGPQLFTHFSWAEILAFTCKTCAWPVDCGFFLDAW